jgi:hypothetical protein
MPPTQSVSHDNVGGTTEKYANMNPDFSRLLTASVDRLRSPAEVADVHEAPSASTNLARLSVSANSSVLST